MMSRQPFYQVGKLLRFYIKREYVKLFTWLTGLVVTTVAVALALSGIYQSDQERQMMAETMENPAMKALIGRGFGIDHYTNGAMFSHEMLLMTMIVVAVMSILLVNRLTRQDEESQQLELLLALPIGRLAPSLSAIALLVITNVLLAITTTVSLTLLQIESINFLGSLSYGLALASSGIFFGAVTLLTAQLSNNQRGAMMLSYLVLGMSYIVRAVGDAGDLWLSFLSPLGILQETQAFVNNYFWPQLIILIFSTVIMVFSMRLREKRDLGSGLLADKKGKNKASGFLKTTPGFILSLQKVPLLSWAVAMLLIGLSYGSVLGDLELFLTENEIIQQIIGSANDVSLTEQFIAIILKVMAIISTIPMLMVFHRLKSEEAKGRLDHLLARPISRVRVYSWYVIISLISSIVLLSLGIFSLAGAGVYVLDTSIDFWTLVQANLVYLPAMWVVLSIMAVLYGLIGKLESLAWLYLLFSFMTIYLGDLLEFPDWLMAVSPFYWVPELPVEVFNVWPLITLTVIAGGLITLGSLGFIVRDVGQS
ncbi:ABC transporter permease [Halolactibacillus alkaliphilus]|uniref:ABC transporter permease n=2 Tax=Halolactibacillus alkaliphilus TaxID=442899 RepID=A0A511X022_9BACI|nr:ABC transporter permease [Halolactibacillus alkaliphilus]GGN67790.1 ABC transporter permease [Halolactibacillus alkaliphilus]